MGGGVFWIFRYVMSLVATGISVQDHEGFPSGTLLIPSRL